MSCKYNGLPLFPLVKGINYRTLIFQFMKYVQVQKPIDTYKIIDIFALH